MSSRDSRSLSVCVFVDTKIEKVRDGGRVARKCVVVPHAVHETDRCEIIGLEVGEAETARGRYAGAPIAWGDRRSRLAGYR